MLPPPELLPYFATAGWGPNWRYDDPIQISATHPAFDLLQRFGGLHLTPQSNSGIECATSDIQIQPVDWRPRLIDEWTSRMASEFCGIALASETYEQIWLLQDGRVFSTNDVTSDLGFVGNSPFDAILNLLTGIRHRPLLAPRQTGVRYYGEDYLRGDPRIYDWTQSAVG